MSWKSALCNVGSVSYPRARRLRDSRRIESELLTSNTTITGTTSLLQGCPQVSIVDTCPSCPLASKNWLRCWHASGKVQFTLNCTPQAAMFIPGWDGRVRASQGLTMSNRAISSASWKRGAEHLSNRDIWVKARVDGWS
jgi:hypothetical protein